MFTPPPNIFLYPLNFEFLEITLPSCKLVAYYYWHNYIAANDNGKWPADSSLMGHAQLKGIFKQYMPQIINEVNI